MIITQDNFYKMYSHLITQKYIAMDTETTSLYPYKEGSKLFGISIATETETFYLNFHDYFIDYEKVPLEYVLPRSYVKKLFPLLYLDTLFFHNAKFDMHFLAKEGVIFNGPQDKFTIHCTMANARVIRNDKGDLRAYSLESLGAEIGHLKDTTVKDYLVKNKHYIKEIIPGQKKQTTSYDYTKVPFDMISKYAMQDARVTFELGKRQLEIIKYEQLTEVSNSENKVTRAFFDMEKVGIKIDPDFIHSAINLEKREYLENEKKFQEISGLEYDNKPKTLLNAFYKLNIPFSLTEKGNPCFNEKALSAIEHPLVDTILNIRLHKKRIETYNSFLYYANNNNSIHCNMLQAGTATGRISIKNPPLQCIEKPDEESPADYSLRGAFVPRENFFFVMMDFDQFEYRMMVNYAREYNLADKINAGIDVHQATADMLGVTRKAAKTLNFMLLYGGGVAKLAASLKISLQQAQDLKYQYFSIMPRVKHFFNLVKDRIGHRGYVMNWMNGRYYIPFDKSYKGVNYIIQGGCAHWLKQAMGTMHDYLRDKRSRMILQIHDEILFEIHKNEIDIIPHLAKMMSNVTDKEPHTLVKYTVGIDYSLTNWSNKQEWKGVL